MELSNHLFVFENNKFEIDDETQNFLNKELIKSIFKILFNEQKITKKEYEDLINKVNRTFNK
ncbi:MAG: hypothetical protein IJ572_01540 [Bacilli bacterium]|nr:hypothetical protein [Bacilli bacterium]